MQFYISSAVLFVFVLFCKVPFPMVILFRFGSDVRRLRLEKRPSPHVLSVFVGKRRAFFSGLAYRSHVFGENGHQKRIIFKTVSRVRPFENAGHLFTCGRTKTEVSEYDDVIHHLPLRDTIVLSLFSVFVWTAKNDSNTVLVEAYFLENGGKNSPFSKISRYVWRGPKTPEPANVCMRIFEKLIHNKYKEQKITQKSSRAWNTTHTEVSRIISYFLHK